jgi:hypothetical protein
MPPLSSVRRNGFYFLFELTDVGGGWGGGMGRVCVSILCVLQVLKMKKICVSVFKVFYHFCGGLKLNHSYY